MHLDLSLLSQQGMGDPFLIRDLGVQRPQWRLKVLQDPKYLLSRQLWYIMIY